MKQIQDEYAGKVRFVFKHNPLPFHQRAVPAAEGYPTATYEGQAEAVAMGDVDDVAMLPTIRSTIR